MRRYKMISFASFKRYCSVKEIKHTEGCSREIRRKYVLLCDYFDFMERCNAKKCPIWKKMQVMDRPIYKKAIRFSILQKHCNEKFKSIKSWKPRFKNKIICGIASKLDFPKHEFDCIKENCPRWHKLTEIIRR